MSNRVEELEAKVAELQAAVNGLTEELVESKERLRELEDAQDVEPQAAGKRSRSEGTEADAAAEDESSESESHHSEILEPTPGTDVDADEEEEKRDEQQDEKRDDDIKSEGGEETDGGGGSDESDIIVA